MERYTIYCTEQQTRKALELGAPIEVTKRLEPLVNRKYISDLSNYSAIIIPTAEEMLGWLNEQGVQITTHVDVFSEWKTYLYKTSSVGIIAESEWRKSRKEAIIDAIDEALNYLSKAKEEKL